VHEFNVTEIDTVTAQMPPFEGGVWAGLHYWMWRVKTALTVKELSKYDSEVS